MRCRLCRLNDLARRSSVGRAGSKLTSTIAFSLAGILTVATVLLSGGVANAWGPIRDTYTMKVPADHVTFNSITDDPSWGDERGFTLIKDVTGSENNMDTAAAGDFAETAEAKDGHTYMVKMFVHNNAAANLNLFANNTRLMAYMPTASGDSAMIQGTIAADNCGANTAGAAGSPCAFWDEAYLTAPEDGNDFKVSYVLGSGRYYNNVSLAADNKDGFVLPDSIVTKDGAQIGYEQMDGRVQGCFQYSGYATFLVYVEEEQADFILTKQLRVEGGDWEYNATANPGDVVEYRIDYTNVGDTDQDDVVIRDTLAKTTSFIADDDTVLNDLDGTIGLNYVNGSTVLYNANNPSGATQTNDEWTVRGLNIGSYAPDSNGIVTYKTVVPEEDELQCGDNVFENVVIASTADGSKLANTKLTVHRECAEPVVPPEEEQEHPGAPEAGVGIKTAVASLVAFLICGAVLACTLAKHKVGENK